MVSKSKSAEIFTTTEISGRNIFRVIGGLVRVFETIFRIFISLKHFLESAALSGNKIRQTEVIVRQDGWAYVTAHGNILHKKMLLVCETRINERIMLVFNDNFNKT